ncbi:hypothetical protein V1638_12790 [Pseudarthrobacter sp. J64]|uniref:hypothetical protein n=1 Tax=Pseudarthrobacter sp. J64 TaxID=3116485 RepID=UPI002E8232F2|nr:hypothetical protein [Pseudarthrobacter sp. J64]MEE2570266.1 hypothetical protein [Pseudarthrobacter sp. J64]
MSRTAVLLMATTTALLTAACSPQEAGCPAIAAAPVVSVTVVRDYVPQVKSLHLKACQEGTCAEGDLDLQPGSVSMSDDCNRDAGPDSVCSATSTPDGTLIGMLMLERLTDAPVDVVLTGTGPDGAPLPELPHTITPIVSTPYGEQCGQFISAAVNLDADGLSSRLPES